MGTTISGTTSTTSASATGTVSIGGLASGVQWRDLVDQLAAADTAQTVTPYQKRITAAQAQSAAWTTMSGLVTKLQTASDALRLGSSFANFSATASASAQTSRTLLSTSANASAVPGSYRVEVVALARSEKVSGSVVPDSSVALGLTGAFAVAGQSVSVVPTDTLDGVRDKINALNSGATPTGVSASIITSAAGQKRLVVSADAAGSTGTGLADGAGGVLRNLGFVDSQSRAVPSASLAIAAALGITMPPPSSIRVGNQTISVDLTVDSLSTIIAKIRAAGGQAEVQKETVGGVPSYRLSVGGNVTASADPNSASTVAALGFAAGGQSTVQQVIASGLSFQDAANNVATGDTRLTDLRSSGASLGVNVGDTLKFSGLRGDGSTVSVAFVVGGADTLQTLLSKLNDATTGFGAGSRPAQASVDPDGKLRLNDQTGGDSRLSLSMTLAPAAGGAPTARLGTFGAETVGRARTIAQGSDAQVRVDGVLVTRNSNTISDAIGGVTMNLLQAEVGTEVDLTVTRDMAAATKGVTDFASAYNDLVTFDAGQQLGGQPLAFNSTLRNILGSFRDAMRTQVAAAGAFPRATLAGVTLNRSGTIDVDATKLGAAMGTNLSSIQTLFGANGIGGAMSTATKSAIRPIDGTITKSITNISDSNSALTKRMNDAQARVEARRQIMIDRFTAMELAISRLQAQGNSLNSSLSGLRGSGR